MNKNEFIKKLEDFKSNLGKDYLENLSKLDLKLEDYKEYSLSFIVSNKMTKEIDNIFIKSCSKWQIGDKFKKIESVFYKTKEEIKESIVWEIYDISIFWDSVFKKYKFTYFVIDANRHPYDQFPKKSSFDYLEDVDITKNNLRTKYYFQKI